LVMKKIIIADALKLMLHKNEGFLHRADVKVFTAGTNDDILAIHQAENVNLIISPLHMPGISSEQLCSTIRKDERMRQVSLLLLCNDTATDQERVSRCNPNAVLTHPFDVHQLLAKAEQLMDIPWRGAFRVLLSVNIEGNSKEKAFFCKSENISASGLLIETDRTFKKGDRVTCSFFLPDSRQLVAHGEVARVLSQTTQKSLNRYGIKFFELAPEVKTAIETFVERKYQQSFWKPA
jgi:CheY-like chemotaxis protein/Tfp pilus assembly protein PilZ